MIKIKTKAVFIFLFSLIISGDSLTQNSRLESALQKAKNNRQELSSVLEHYSKEETDTLKFKATCFLIEHMQDHYTYYNEAIESYYNSMSIVFNRPGKTGEAEKKYYNAKYDSILFKSEFQMIEAPRIYDITTIKADYLIKNIDEAFEMWRAPWGLRVDFDLFCKYILPYRVGEEPLSDWRYLYKERKGDKMKALHARPNATFLYGLCNALNWNYIDNLYIPFGFMPEFPLNRLIDIKCGTCRDYAYMATAYCRSMGLPVAIDFCPQWGGRSMGHEWNVLLPQKNVPLPFAVNGTFSVHLYDIFEEIVTKVYRKTYHNIDGNLHDQANGIPIPPLFDTPYLLDVTGDYADTTTIEASVFSEKIDNKDPFAYLSVFNNQGWTIVQWGKIENGTVKFKAMGKECVYLPVAYRENQAEDQPIGYPILCRSNGNIQLRPNKNRTQKVRLTRKYRYSRNLQECADRLVGGYFQIANNADFSDAITIDSITVRPESHFNKVSFPKALNFRYFRYVGAKGMNCNIAEIVLYDSKGERLQPDSIYAIDNGRYGTTPQMVFDKKTLTHFSSKNNDNGWIAAGFRDKKELSAFYYLPRNDDNFICEGEVYELYYWEKNGWCLIGKKGGTIDSVLEYDNVPTNALFLLRNRTKGKEERIFTYENEQQIWW